MLTLSSFGSGVAASRGSPAGASPIAGRLGGWRETVSFASMAEGLPMTNKSAFYVSSLVIVPVLFVLFYALRLVGRVYAIDQWVPKWDTLLILATMITVERIYTYRYAVSQKSVLPRDVISNVVNLYVTGTLTGMLVLPVLVFFPEHFLGRKVILASPAQLGPVWLQVPVILLSVSLFRYWMHRLQHSVPFLWELHSYHHRVTDLQATNTYVSHPIDFALRNVIIFLALGVIGFSPFALLIAVPATNISGTFSHCGGDVKGGLLNYLFVTPEVHRWHHSVKIPEGYGHSCNYGVEFSFWDIVFGTYYLPVKNGVAQQPERIGYPGGELPDESSYLKLLLVPLKLYGPASRLVQVLPMPRVLQRQPSAE
jgi:sterol desaturase/sphingolipid hydroxylase (fatty acid hydroxylase superfamily)